MQSNIQERYISAGVGIDKNELASNDSKPLNAEKLPDPKPYNVIESKWSDLPSVEDQFSKYPDTCKIDRIVVDVFDLNKADDIERLSKIESQHIAQNTNLIIIEREKHFCEKIGNWKVFIRYAHIKFKKIVPTGDIK